MARDNSSRRPGLPELIQTEHEAVFTAATKQNSQDADARAHMEKAVRRLNLLPE